MHAWCMQHMRTVLLQYRPAAVLAKIGIDQTVMAPIGTAAFFAALNLMEGKPDQIVPSLQVCIKLSA